MSNFRPIAMRCTQEQFEEIKPKLKGLNIHEVDFYNFICNSYLTNNLNGRNYVLSNISEHCKRDFNREVHEEWNEEIFLEACGIVPCTIQDRLANLEKEIKEVKALIGEENKPKIGDICKLWDGDKNDFMIGKLEHFDTIDFYPYYSWGMGFENCEKITDENFLKAFNSL